MRKKLILPSSNHDPGGLKQREGDEADRCRGRDKKGIADFPSEQDSERDDADKRGKPVPDCDLAEKDTGSIHKASVEVR
jgi:hypothetical protein